MEKYVVLDKKEGQTPLECAEAWRRNTPAYAGVPLAYAGRLDPMATGKLLVLIGEECKNQTTYHGLDKAYEFSVLLGVHSDTSDILGLVATTASLPTCPSKNELEIICKSLEGDIEVPYPIFSAKTVQGKPLHMWTLENRLNEITIPTKKSKVFKLRCTTIESITRAELCSQALTRIELPTSTTDDERKALGNDFRRPEVREAWHKIKVTGAPKDIFYLVTFSCIASSGTYMRTLAEVIAQRLGTSGLAYSIHRTTIGRYQPVFKSFGFWKNKY